MKEEKQEVPRVSHRNSVVAKPQAAARQPSGRAPSTPPKKGKKIDPKLNPD